MSQSLGRTLMAVAVGLAAISSGCANPSWRSDNYMVEGTLSGSTCQMTLNGRPFTAQDGLFDERIRIRRNPEMNAGLPAGRGVTALYCLGLQLLIVSPVGTFPLAGRYHAIGGRVGNDTGVVALRVHFRGLSEGNWPFALGGIHLDAKDGYLQLDEMTANTASGTFRAVMRRQSDGE